MKAMTDPDQAQGGPRFAYEDGEEVVVRLDGAEVRRADGADTAEPLPAWMIGEITARETHGVDRVYRVRFTYEGAAYECVVREEAIDGVA